MSESTHGEEKFATMAQVKALVRRKLRKHPAHEEQSLNIYPIILVFLIMSVANETANIVQSDDLQLPFTTSTQETTQSLAIQISRTEVIVDGAPVVNLRNGVVDPAQKQGGGANGFLVTPLLAAMQAHRDRLKLIAERNPRRPFTGEVQIIADKRTPFRTLSEIIYTIGQAEFAHMHFVSIQEAQAAEQHGTAAH
jgi:biopolymer transport protein ExbD